MKADFPLIYETAYRDPLQIFYSFYSQQGALFLDSSQYHEQLGRYSFIAIDPFQIINSKNDGNPLVNLQKTLAQYSLARVNNMPPFQGGICGYFSYDLYHYLENITDNRSDDTHFPDMVIGLYDLVIAFDHYLCKAWIFSSGYPEQQPAKRLLRAQERYRWLVQLLEKVPEIPPLSNDVCNPEEIVSNFDQASYEQAVAHAVDYIYAGDIFEVNISQRFSAPLPENVSAFQLYCRLRKLNKAPFSSYLNFEDTIIASSSPERFLRLDRQRIETRPIKGTCKRGATQQEDVALAKELMASEKDRAENIMIVDLMRNDLSRVSKAHTVKVEQLCQLESYATVHHLVSVITAELEAQYNAIDLLKAAFPGGSVTGAPKVRAMEIITEIEPHRRGPYCGCIGYMGFNGDMDTAITIRTYAIKNDTVYFQAGGAITADSKPSIEYQETLNKAWALQQALMTYDINNR